MLAPVSIEAIPLMAWTFGCFLIGIAVIAHSLGDGDKSSLWWQACRDVCGLVGVLMMLSVLGWLVWNN